MAYLALVASLRLSGKRTLSKLNAFDLVVTVALGSSLASATVSNQVPLITAVVAFAALVGLQLAVALTTSRWPGVRAVVTSRPTLVVCRGVICEEHLRRERLTAGEVRQVIRQDGQARVEDVAAVVLESDGSFSVVPGAGPGEPSALDGVDRCGRCPFATGG